MKIDIPEEYVILSQEIQTQLKEALERLSRIKWFTVSDSLAPVNNYKA